MNDISTANSAGTMFAAINGGEQASTQVQSAEADEDEFSLFVARADAMGWADAEGDAGLWGMNDAGGSTHGLREVPGLRGWFQVEVCPVADRSGLPVQPFLQCAVDVCERLGKTGFDEFSVLVPVHKLGPRRVGARAAMRSAQWFGAQISDRVTSVTATVSVGQGFPGEFLDSAIADFLKLPQGALTDAKRSNRSGRQPKMLFDDSFWSGPATKSVTLDGNLIAWTPDAIGWVVQALSECGAAHGIAGPIVVTVSRRSS